MDSLKINLGEEIAIVRPVPFAHLAALSELFVELHALWLGAQLSLADLLISDKSALAQDLIGKIAALHPRVDTPAQSGFPIAPLLDDLPQLEALFFMQRSDSSDKLDLDRGAKLLRLNRFNPEKKYQEASQKQLETLEESPVVETPEPISSPISPTSSETTELPKTSAKAKTSNSSSDSASAT
jgi:hypothetical protein